MYGCVDGRMEECINMNINACGFIHVASDGANCKEIENGRIIGETQELRSTFSPCRSFFRTERQPHFLLPRGLNLFSPHPALWKGQLCESAALLALAVKSFLTVAASRGRCEQMQGPCLLGKKQKNNLLECVWAAGRSDTKLLPDCF